MKKHLTIIAMAAMAFLASCSSSDQNTATVAVQDEKPKVKIANSTVEDVEQLHEFTTTVEAEVKNNISPSSNLRISKIYAEVGDNVTKGQKLVQLDASNLEQLALQIENQKVEFNVVDSLSTCAGGLQLMGAVVGGPATWGRVDFPRRCVGSLPSKCW